MFQIQDPAANLRLSAEDLNFRARILISDRGFEPGLDIRGLRVRIPQELDFVAFSSWNLDVVAFCPLKKRLGITMLWLICLRFSMSWFFGLGISMSWFFGLGISMSCICASTASFSLSS